MAEILIDGQKVHYQCEGRGKPLLLLHGWGASCLSFAALMPHLARHFTVYALDFPGFGQSPPPQSVWGVGDYAYLTEKFLKQLAIDKPLIMGHSFGGRVSILLGARGLPAKLILVDSAGLRPRRSLKYYLRVYSYKAAKSLFSLPLLRNHKERALAFWLRSNPSSDYKQAQGVMRQVFVKVVNEDLRRHLPKIKAPTLLLWGELDTAVPLSDARLMERLIPGSGLAVLPGAGHFCFLDKPREFLLIVDSFLGPEKT
ncbi:MAG: alpha/beta hydrolase [Clostridiales bacterium]|nr:alpha/beta hydrolase [Clostridiales bacterium]